MNNQLQVLTKLHGVDEVACPFGFTGIDGKGRGIYFQVTPWMMKYGFEVILAFPLLCYSA